MGYHRNPKTTNERRAYEELKELEEEYEVTIRARKSRSNKGLVDSYDDLYKASNRDKHKSNNKRKTKDRKMYEL
jgi:hypothetical protein